MELLIDEILPIRRFAYLSALFFGDTVGVSSEADPRDLLERITFQGKAVQRWIG